MTHEEIIEKYGDVVLEFSYYYKFVFYYRATAEDGITICAQFGGDSDEIYRTQFSPKERLSSLIYQCYLLDLRIKEDN